MAVLALACIGLAPARGAEGMLSVQKHFEWGEYDSLLVQVPPLLSRRPPPPADQRARLAAYLALAEYMRGDGNRADSLYRLALDWDPAFGFDSVYVEGRALRHFRALAPEPAHGHAPVTPGPVPGRGWAYLSGAGLGLGTVLAAAAAAEYAAGDKAAAARERAFAAKDGAAFEREARRVRERDAAALWCGGGSLACLGLGGMGLFLALRRPKGAASNLAVTWSPAGGALAWERGF